MILKAEGRAGDEGVPRLPEEGMKPFEALLPSVMRLVEAAGNLVLTEYDRLVGGSAGVVRLKADQSPFTTADAASHRLLAEGLAALDLRYPIVSEEGASPAYEERASWERFWLVDPLDGTKEFLSRNGEFTVNVGLIEHGMPILGIVHAPALKKTYWAARGLGAWLRDEPSAAPRRLHVADYRKAAMLKVVVSRSHPGPLIDGFLGAIGACQCENIGSSLKFCRIAEGSAHLYPRFGPTMEWDVAAAHCIVREAGGIVTDLAGRELHYNKADLHNPFFVVAGDPAFGWQRFISDDVRLADLY